MKPPCWEKPRRLPRRYGPPWGDSHGATESWPQRHRELGALFLVPQRHRDHGVLVVSRRGRTTAALGRRSRSLHEHFIGRLSENSVSLWLTKKPSELSVSLWQSPLCGSAASPARQYRGGCDVARRSPIRSRRRT